MPAAIPTPIAYEPPPLTCSITEQHATGSVLLSGEVASAADTQGRYTLRVAKAGPSGTSRLNQSGAFSAHAGLATKVGNVSISLEPGASFDATLTVEANGRSFQCEKHGARS